MRKSEDKYDFCVRWDPFFLSPDTPAGGIPMPDDFSSAIASLKENGKAVGIDFTCKTELLPNTTLVHTLVEYSKQAGGSTQNDLVEVLFKAHFTDAEGQTLDNLLKYAKSVGLDVDATKSHITNPDNQKVITSKAKEWSDKGVTEVPYFVINGEAVFHGDKDEASFLKEFERLAKR
ncbi:uncharacterized protein LOC100375474 [Saccoglossus kowalevskii]|uniref:Uncharacterized protein LOC100375474 n=1 Tax=Saccoglossus kowalevskii TaxID=10224 RepID=A0ABM0GPX2_SACKO|nr:PREDICTED: uncharacterized protein LOC100375474 [Saccoglossus kowalevskii]